MAFIWGDEKVKPIRAVVKKVETAENSKIIDLTDRLEKLSSKSEVLNSIKHGSQSLVWKTRLLDAAEGKPREACKMVEKMLSERAALGIDNCQQWELRKWSKVEKTFPFNVFYGLTKQNVPLSISIMGTVDTGKVQHQILHSYPEKIRKKEDHAKLTVKYLKDMYILQLEWLRKKICVDASSKAGSEIWYTCTLIDMGGLSASQMLIPMWVLTFTSFVSHCENVIYPGVSGQIFMLNCNLLFTTLWAMISPLLGQKLNDKIKVLGHDWKKYLKNIVHLKKLPPSLGGKGPKLHKHPFHLSWKKSLVNHMPTVQKDEPTAAEEDEMSSFQEGKEKEQNDSKMTLPKNEDSITRSNSDESTGKSKIISKETESSEQGSPDSKVSEELPVFQKPTEKKMDI